MGTPELPSTVAIGPVDYTVAEDSAEIDDVRRHCGDRRLAETDTAVTRILLDPHLSAARKRETLLHECIHALLYEFNIETPDDDEESLVESLGVAFLALVRDNPHLIRFLAA